MIVRRLEQAGIVVLVLLIVVLPTAIHGWPATLAGNVFTAALVASGLTLLWWRSHPRPGRRSWAGRSCSCRRPSATTAGSPTPPFVIMALLATVAALGWRGRAAGVVAVGLAAYLVVSG